MTGPFRPWANLRQRLACAACPAFVAAALVALAGCQDSPPLTGIAAGLDTRAYGPRQPLTTPDHATFAFQPFAGVPGNTGDDLLRALWSAAEREGLTVNKRPGGRAVYFVEAALSATSDSNASTIFYVFDVTDVTGRRLHRISGQQLSGDSASDPWASVDQGDLDALAARTAALLKAWVNRQA